MFEGLVSEAFPADVSVAWGEVGGEVPLLPEEQALVARAVESRRREFAQGRACARRALAALGVASTGPLLAGPDREPLWPSGVVGSITHDRELSVAVVATALRYAGLGVDVEPDEPLEPAVAERIWSDAEAASAARAAVVPPESAAKLVFSIKEAVYKCQFPLTGSYVGFGGVSVELSDGTFAAFFSEAVGPLPARYPFRGRWRRAAGKLLASAWIERG
jgi:4'-phosphopantetheinyl transferase EntD